MTLKYVCTVKSGPGPLNISFGSDMPITLLHLMLISKIYVVNSDMKNVIGMSQPNVMFKGAGSLHQIVASKLATLEKINMQKIQFNELDLPRTEKLVYQIQIIESIHH